jgi:hypothetical protein
MSPVSISIRSCTPSSVAFRIVTSGRRTDRACPLSCPDPAAAQPSRDGDGYGAAPAAHVEHAFVAAQAQPIEDFPPDLELATPGGVEKTGGVSQEETGIQRHARRQARDAVRPRDDRHDEADGAEHCKRNGGIGRVVAVLACGSIVATSRRSPRRTIAD